MNYINKNILFISISIFLAISLGRDYRDLNIDFLLGDTTSTIKKKHGVGSKNASKKSFHNITLNLKKIESTIDINFFCIFILYFLKK